MAADQLSTTFSALADPTRREILFRIKEGEDTVGQLAQRFPMTVQAISKHLGVLERAGLVERSRAAQLRPAHIRPTHFQQAAEWLQSYAFWDASFDKLEDKLAERPSDG